MPGELTVDAGQSVTFVNAHSDEHTATGSGFDTGIIPEGGIATVVLDTPGSFRHACQIHPEMTGRIDVRGPDGTVPQQAAEQPPADATTVSIASLAFNPAEIAVPVGTTVAWTNDDAVPHTVTALDGAFDSGIFDPGASFSWMFDQPGAFAYQCLLHPSMQGTVRVDGEAAAAASQATLPPETCEPAVQATPAAEGVWGMEFSPDDPATFAGQQALVTLRPDGTLAADFVATAEAAAPSALLDSGHGEWLVRDDALALALAALLHDESRRFAGMVTMAAEGRLDAAGTTLEGTFTLEVSAPDGASQGQAAGTIAGVKIPLEP